MSQFTLLLPVFAQVALTLGLLTWLGLSRVNAVNAGAVKIKDTALGQKSWPDSITQIGNCYANQFEVPVLFYALIALLLITGKGDGLMLGLAWAFVATRLAHAYVHTTSNYVRHRFMAFLAGVIILAVMWIIFGVRMLASGG